MKPCYLIDSSIYIFRYYFSQNNFHESLSGREVGTTLAYFRWLLRFLSKESPEHVAACFDESLGSCFRNEINPLYKSNRTLPDDELAYQLLACKKLTELVGIPSYASSRYEADDLIATLFDYGLAQGMESIVLTRDKDLGQLLQKEIGMFWDYGYDDPIAYDSFTREFGIAPERIPEYLALVGDKADAIDGIKGIGKKTAAALFNAMGAWDQIKKNIAEIASLDIRGAAGVAKKIEGGIALVDENLGLTQLHRRCIDEKNIDLQRKSVRIDELIPMLEEFAVPASMLKSVEALNS